MTAPFLKELLLISNTNVMGLAEYLNKTALLFVLPCFYLGLLFEFFSNWRFQDVAKRSLIAFLAIKLMTPLHVQFVDMGLKVSSQLLKEYSPRNKFLTAYRDVKMDKKTSMWKKLSSIVEIISDPIVMIIFLASYIAFFLLTQLYSLTYHLTIAFIGLCALLSIFPMTSRSLTGAIKTSLWCILMPFIVAIVLCLIGDSDAFLKTYSGGIVNNLESLIQLLIMTILLLMTPMITNKLMSEAGISQVAENIGQMAAMTTMMGGAKLLKAGVMASTGGAAGATVSPLLRMGKSALSSKASAIMDKKGIAPKVSSVASINPVKERLGDKLSNIGKGVKSSSLKEMATLGADSIINRKENKLAQYARSRDAEAAIEFPHLQSESIPLSSYKREVQDFYRNTGDPKDSFEYGRLKFMDHHHKKGESNFLNKPMEESAYVHSSEKWKNFTTKQKNWVHDTYGKDGNFNGKEGFVYFPTHQDRGPVPLRLYNRTFKPQKMKEHYGHKTFLSDKGSR